MGAGLDGVTMSKFADQLELLGVYNNHTLLMRFARPDRSCVAVDYRLSATRVWSPRRFLDPRSHWSNTGAKVFCSIRSHSMPVALAWATKVTGVIEWAVSHFGGRVPKYVVDAAKLAVRQQLPTEGNAGEE